MATKYKPETNVIVVEVMAPHDVPEDDRDDFEDAVISFLFGSERVRPELHEELSKRGVDLNTLASLCAETPLAVCPDPDARPFLPGPELVKLAASKGLKFTEGGCVRVEFDYCEAGRASLNAGALNIKLRLPYGLAREVTGEHTAAIAHALFGDCNLPLPAQQYLLAHGVHLEELARGVHESFRRGHLPPTSRVSPEVGERLRRHGLDVDQFGRLEVAEVSDL
jgi:hypothetical protein